MNAIKGSVYRRKDDGFVFVVQSASKVAHGVSMQCLDAARIFGWFPYETLALSFDRVPKAEAQKLAKESLVKWSTMTGYPEMKALAIDTIRRNGGTLES